MQAESSTKFVPAQCPSCGGALQVPDNREKVLCMYCGTTIMLYQKGNSTTARTSHITHLLNSARTELQRQNSAKAYNYFQQAVEEDPQNIEAWLGRAVSCLKRVDELDGIEAEQAIEEGIACSEKALSGRLEGGQLAGLLPEYAAQWCFDSWILSKGWAGGNDGQLRILKCWRIVWEYLPALRDDSRGISLANYLASGCIAALQDAHNNGLTAGKYTADVLAWVQETLGMCKEWINQNEGPWEIPPLTGKQKKGFFGLFG